MVSQITFRKMSNIYLTLVSDVTKKYTSNVANQFKVKPQLRLPGEGWKVSVAGAILPKMPLFKELQSANVNLIELWGETEKAGQSDAWQKGYVKATDLREWEKAETCHTGEEFFNTVKHRLEETAHASLDDGFKFSSARWINLAWDKKGVHPELVLTNTKTSNLIYIYKPFAKSLRWINPKTNQHDSMGPNLVHSYPNHTKGASSLETGKPTQILGNWPHLSTLSDWRFIKLNQCLKDALNLHPRPLTVTANVTANKETVTQSLGQVYYAPQGRQRYAFTPVQETFQEVQDNHWGEVETTLKELDGTLVQFQSDSQCVIRLHFKKE